MSSRVSIFLVFILPFTLLNSMQRGEAPSESQILSDCTQNMLNGKLQTYLYAKLDKLWVQQPPTNHAWTVNHTWKLINDSVFHILHPVLLYFVFRTYYDFAYAFDGKKIQDLPQNPNLSLDRPSRIGALACLMMFRMKSRIDTDICIEKHCPDASNWIHEEFGHKFKNRISVFYNWDIKFQQQGEGPLTFRTIFEWIQNRYSTYPQSQLWQAVSPEWVCFCTKSRWSYFGLWAETFYFNDIPKEIAARDMQVSRIDYGVQSKVAKLFARIKVLADDDQIDEIEKWNQFLAI